MPNRLLARLRSGLLATLGVLLAFSVAAVAEAQTRKYSSIVLDAETRQIVFAEDPDGVRYPASLTKIMTMYLVFDALDRGRLRLDQRIPVSVRAASQAPSSLGLRPGTRISVEDALLGVAVKSANDAAVVLAEAIAGSETAFAKLMTDKARALGMHNTTFRNASGLPHSQQRTTARDMATLGLAVLNHHPRHYHYFSIREFSFEGRIHSNHNRLLGQMDGADGIKTGFINASGFNLVASVKRDGRRLIGVVFGGNTSRERDLQMVRLLESGFGRDDDEIRTARRTGGNVVASFSPISPAEAATSDDAPGIGSAGPASRWSIQVGAFQRAQSAQQEARKAISSASVLVPGRAIAAAEKDGGSRLYRARVNSLSEAEARDACRQLARRKMNCMVVAPRG